MAIKRHEIQQYADSTMLAGETVAPTNNDVVSLEDTRRLYQWVEGSVKVHDETYVIEQTSESANGRWELYSASDILFSDAVSTTDELNNGQQSEIIVTVTGANATLANIASVIVAPTSLPLPEGVYVTSATVVADDTVLVVFSNQSGTDGVAPIDFDVRVIVF